MWYVITTPTAKYLFGHPGMTELSALLAQWNRDGWRHLMREHHRKVGAVCGVVRSADDEPGRLDGR